MKSAAKNVQVSILDEKMGMESERNTSTSKFANLLNPENSRMSVDSRRYQSGHGFSRDTESLINEHNQPASMAEYDDENNIVFGQKSRQVDLEAENPENENLGKLNHAMQELRELEHLNEENLKVWDQEDTDNGNAFFNSQAGPNDQGQLSSYINLDSKLSKSGEDSQKPFKYAAKKTSDLSRTPDRGGSSQKKNISTKYQKPSIGGPNAGRPKTTRAGSGNGETFGGALANNKNEKSERGRSKTPTNYSNKIAKNDESLFSTKSKKSNPKSPINAPRGKKSGKFLSDLNMGNKPLTPLVASNSQNPKPHPNIISTGNQSHRATVSEIPTHTPNYDNSIPEELGSASNCGNSVHYKTFSQFNQDQLSSTSDGPDHQETFMPQINNRSKKLNKNRHEKAEDLLYQDAFERLQRREETQHMQRQYQEEALTTKHINNKSVRILIDKLMFELIGSLLDTEVINEWDAQNTNYFFEKEELQLGFMDFVNVLYAMKFLDVNFCLPKDEEEGEQRDEYPFSEEFLLLRTMWFCLNGENVGFVTLPDLSSFILAIYG